MSEQNGQIDPVDDIYTDPTPVIEMVKLQISFWEKLVVLDATTLALSFTASGFFREHLIGDGGVGYLAAAWKLLFGGIVFALIAQWLTIPGLLYATGQMYGMRVLSLLGRKDKVGEEEIALMKVIVADSPRYKRRGNYILRTAGGAGSLGLFLSMAAFYWLYRFAHENVVTVGR